MRKYSSNISSVEGTQNVSPKGSENGSKTVFFDPLINRNIEKPEFVPKIRDSDMFLAQNTD